MRLIATFKGCSDELFSIILHRVSTEGVLSSKTEKFIFSSVQLLASHVNKGMNLNRK